MNNDRLDQLETLLHRSIEKRKALARRVDDLEAENEELKDQIAEMQTAVAPDTERSHYADMDRGEKVHRLRVALLRDAQDTHNGKRAFTYKDVKTVFDGHPSNGHCYDLMEDAGTAAGFEYDTNVGGSKVIRVNTAAVEDDALFRAANKTEDGVTA